MILKEMAKIGSIDTQVGKTGNYEIIQVNSNLGGCIGIAQLLDLL